MQRKLYTPPIFCKKRFDAFFGKNARLWWMGFAMLMVIFDHAVLYQNSSDKVFFLMKVLFNQGGFGVNIFLIVSAYGLCHSFQNKPLIDFYLSRVAKLYPVYLTFMIFLTYTLWSGENLWLHWFRQSTGLCALFIGEDEWYIPSLVLMYLCFPLVFHICRWLSDKNVIAIFLPIAVSTYVYYFISGYINWLFFLRFHCILLGCMFYFIKDEAKIVKLLTLTSSLALFTLMDTKFFYVIPLLIYAICKSNFVLPFKNIVSFMGAYSLEIYLGQFVGFQYFFKYKFWDYGYWVNFLISLCITFIMSVFFILVQKYFSLSNNFFIKF